MWLSANSEPRLEEEGQSASPGISDLGIAFAGLVEQSSEELDEEWDIEGRGRFTKDANRACPITPGA